MEARGKAGPETDGANATSGDGVDSGVHVEFHASYRFSSCGPQCMDREGTVKLYRRIMRFFSKTCESERMDFRKEMHRVEAYAQNMHIESVRAKHVFAVISENKEPR